MKKLFVLIAGIFFLSSVQAQLFSPVQWSFSVKKLNVDTYEFHATALIDNKWHLYSQDAGKGPVPTKITFTINPLLIFEGAPAETGKLEKSFDANFNSELRYYETKVDFVQKIKLKKPVSTLVKGSVTFMVCNDRQCLPPKEIPFSVKLGGK